ncbi:MULTISPECIES: class I SAM-dependent methyltransferase [Paracoccus]|jgi:phosphatidylethanolamine/phosphatidyl-N-methylethanolamine N-methyltransferase|uniref:Phosphatidyl-N-methylethanolamine N-methyltransferase n=1 Tax=Paracoccus denitrificans (strain Pd 1222) TaxID=318586 RepID=A1BB57_PARDP|nr:MULTISPECIES: class I SAM-dependent methyltransferase [Paracoccus]ABL72751.1 phosphatidyl-N-methylethanolamine N-methyltransferase [Paracoccus denitrificans PD1222]MBB4626229.1 phosphatidylethanolamine/phosphatidyl-N-methylethanolamine N-methyltransferase [Paracoccus denitrificans]MCU7427564.1 class I SAM-dependent methyltransferase [Paracoccus denitrificans]MDK8871080.1 class I SAM-dependent methyltransferase [Paracoccus sp. SSJ]QAR29713.1 methyltransferase domain-containing protein [Parac
MDIEAIQSSYSRWAPIYDRTFGAATSIGRRRAVDHINRRGGTVLEVGVGTGLSLEHYGPQMQVTGIDFSQDMLDKAIAKVQRLGLKQVHELRQMDARALDFPDDHFDTVTAMHVLSVVPEPERVMAEIARVCKPGGKVVITNHFARESGAMAAVERVFAPLANTIGWHSDFRIDRVLGQESLVLEERRTLPPLGMMTFLVLGKVAG